MLSGRIQEGADPALRASVEGVFLENRQDIWHPERAGHHSCNDLQDWQPVPTISCSWCEWDVLCGCRAAQGHTGPRKVNLSAATGIRADLVMLVEVELPRVHDLPVKKPEQSR